MDCGLEPFAEFALPALRLHTEAQTSTYPLACLSASEVQHLLIGPKWKGHVSLLHFWALGARKRAQQSWRKMVCHHSWCLSMILTQTKPQWA